jgi:hypothetical protein
VDWFGIVDSFDPKTLDRKFLDECARRNPYDTCYKWDTPSMPIEERLRHSESGIRFDRQSLEEWIQRIDTEGLNESLYKNARRVLIKLIGSMGAHEYNLREYEALGEFGRKKQENEYRKYEQELEAKQLEEEESPVEDLLLERLIFRCHANPYWLYDSECESDFGSEDPHAYSVLCGDEPCIYASPDVILKWIKEEKPRDTYWTDGCMDSD